MDDRTGDGSPSSDSTAGLDRLAPGQRHVLDLDAAGMAAADIAAELDVPIEAIPSLLRIALAKADAIRRPARDE
jgi:DNA-directed RNA polymerase specialized sigma24 family protein